jgi:hypothetical protein
VYEIPKPADPSIKTYFEEFQCCEFTSDEVATPTSPIAPCLESGAIVKKGTAVVIGFDSIACPDSI